MSKFSRAIDLLVLRKMAKNVFAKFGITCGINGL
ncbi:hypothetical protein T4C_9202 [Trichinella pseudospiralis]|uniref:Uncharacterized protein n=1 Tax=Trichinella pseudospiralis TaxID=6337 RepID=A0A0V1GH62_TRIPS|nr:hypothetical protein T4C_9202 [Trichinella pseudospiralis]